jgi:hypothetical protein
MRIPSAILSPVGGICEGWIGLNLSILVA